jgi:hypothetical protein
MRLLKKQLSWWPIVLIIGVAASAIPIASHVSSTAKAVVKERQDYPDLQSTAGNVADVKHSKARQMKQSKAAVGLSMALLQDILYDRRSQYWDKRVLRRLESREEYLDEQTGDDEDDAKDSKAAKNKDSKDDDEDVDDVDKEVERRREYWRKRLDRDW